MTILIIDDQISVVSGLIFGIDWKKTGIQKVLKAYSANEAKEIIKSQKVDIMLCDIEMPVENGLSLFSWVRRNEYDIECIFLTAHADFIYAKEAIQLGSFDYILQPARYEEIEKAVEKLIGKIQIRRKKEEMAYCSDLFQKRRDILLDAVLQRMFLETGDLQKQALNDLKNLNIPLAEDEKSYVVWLQIQEENTQMKEWDSDLLKYAITNILEELFYNYGYGVLLYARDRNEYIIYFYRKESHSIEKEIVLQQLAHFIELYREYYGCTVRGYIAGCEKLSHIRIAVEQLEIVKQKDVTKGNTVMDADDIKNSPAGYEQVRKYFAAIEPLLQNELYEKICDDVLEIIENMAEKKVISSEILKCFYQDFLSLVYQAAAKYGKTLSEMFDEEEQRERALSAYSSLEDMKWFIKYIMAYLNEMSMSDEKQKSQIDSIRQYIRSNMEMDIKRTDIAELVHLNPNYVSRLFKSETGMSLKEYIMSEKMELAKDLVRSTNLPISVITMKVGYNNFSYFAQVYKKMNGLSPLEDREVNGKMR
ncbi:response regulator transcription factor [Kineothrix sedimenti]|uniref:Stage 0 sporulation protein A homolog n=1 Tax=Kineothrix sedimenti TaxID=3123317 RepID=A0ABZ3EXQ4_9FIRM